MTNSLLSFPCGSAGKESTCNAGDLGSIPGLGRSPGEGKGYPLQSSGLENSMDYIHGVAKSQTWQSNFHFQQPAQCMNLYLAELYETLYFNLCRVVCVHLERVSEYVALKRRTLWGKNCAGEGNHRKWRAKRLLQKAVLESYLKVQRDRHFPGDSDVKESASNAEDPGSIPGSGRPPWRREWLVFLPGEYCEQRRLLGSQKVGHD